MINYIIFPGKYKSRVDITIRNKTPVGHLSFFSNPFDTQCNTKFFAIRRLYLHINYSWID